MSDETRRYRADGYDAGALHSEDFEGTTEYEAVEFHASQVWEHSEANGNAELNAAFADGALTGLRFAAQCNARRAAREALECAY